VAGSYQNFSKSNFPRPALVPPFHRRTRNLFEQDDLTDKFSGPELLFHAVIQSTKRTHEPLSTC